MSLLCARSDPRCEGASVGQKARVARDQASGSVRSCCTHKCGRAGEQLFVLRSAAVRPPPPPPSALPHPQPFFFLLNTPIRVLASLRLFTPPCFRLQHP